MKGKGREISDYNRASLPTSDLRLRTSHYNLPSRFLPEARLVSSLRQVFWLVPVQSAFPLCMTRNSGKMLITFIFNIYTCVNQILMLNIWRK